MRGYGKISAWIRPAGPAILLLLGTLASPAMAGSRTSANYTITADTNDSGGGHASSAAYANEGSLGNVAGSSTSAAFTLASGYPAQIQPIGAAPVITSALTAGGTYGSPISTYTITATNSPTSYDAAGLPDGLAVDTGTGAITGTPTAAGGPTNVTISATNANGTGSATLVFTIAKAAQTITFAGPANQVYSPTPIALNASASSLLAVTFSVVSGPATVSGKFLTLTGSGTVVIRASQAGNSNYLAAPDVDRTLIVFAAASDFNGDGKADIVWQNTSIGDRGFWLMNGTVFASWVDMGYVSPDWHIAAVADFNGDGKTDILWENTSTGDRGFWLMNGTAYASWVDMGYVSTDWHIAAVADFNEDGKPDILWENTVTGVRGFWLMNGTAYASWVNMGYVSTDWRFVAAADFNGDGNADILMENTVTGDRGFWLMNGTAYASWVDMGYVSTDWHIAAVADFNGDGKPDILWENTVTGDRGFWLMNGTVFSSWVDMGYVGTDWRIAP